ncbi:MAG: OmpA family protein [Verrucomicrobiota bacterium]
MNRRRIHSLFALSAAVTLTSSLADDRLITAQDLIHQLSHQASGPSSGFFGGFGVGGGTLSGRDSSFLRHGFSTTLPVSAHNLSASANVPMEQVAVPVTDRSVSMDNILFHLNSVEFRDDMSQRQVRTVADALRRMPNQRFLIEGHSCDLGTDQHNLTLSYYRAERVRDELIRYGVNPNQIEALGFGEREQLHTPNPYDSHYQREAIRSGNRRVTVRGIAAQQTNRKNQGNRYPAPNDTRYPNEPYPSSSTGPSPNTDPYGREPYPPAEPYPTAESYPGNDPYGEPPQENNRRFRIFQRE